MKKLIFDLESTGLNIDSDRIVELSIQIVNEDNNVILNKTKLYNPTIPITKQAFETHGISDDDVKKATFFKKDAENLKKIFENKIIIGFNILKFDIPLLLSEFERAGVTINFPTDIIDVLDVERKLNSNSLASLFKRYTGEELKNAHSAANDVFATYEIFKHHNKLIPSIEELKSMSGTSNMAEHTGKLIYDDAGYLVINFGQKAKGQRVIDAPEFSDWILKNNFSQNIKDLITKERKKHNTFALQFKKTPTVQRSIDFSNVSSPSKYNGSKSPNRFLIDDDLPF